MDITVSNPISKSPFLIPLTQPPLHHPLSPTPLCSLPTPVPIPIPTCDTGKYDFSWALLNFGIIKPSPNTIFIKYKWLKSYHTNILLIFLQLTIPRIYFSALSNSYVCLSALRSTAGRLTGQQQTRWPLLPKFGQAVTFVLPCEKWFQ